MKLLSRFIDSNDRELRRIQPQVDAANALESDYEALSDEMIAANAAAGGPLNLSRADHRAQHLDEVDQVLARA
jgi:preprotein translocase subunit SecA